MNCPDDLCIGGECPWGTPVSATTTVQNCFKIRIFFYFTQYYRHHPTCRISVYFVHTVMTFYFVSDSFILTNSVRATEV